MLNMRAIVLVACCLLTHGATAEERRYSLLEREIEYLMEIWPGDYDNREQVQFDTIDGKTTLADGAHPRIHTQISRADLPDLGEYVLYVSEYRDNDPDNVVLRGLYELIADDEEKAVRVRQHAIRDSSEWPAPNDDAIALTQLASEDIVTVEGCDLLLHRDVDALVGGTMSQNCKPGTEDANRYADRQVRITETGYWIHDRAAANAPDKDESLTGTGDRGWHQLERARWFQCMLDFPREDGGRPVNTVEYVRIHDQGGAFPFRYRDGRDMVLTLRNNWSYGMQRETLVVVVQEGDESGPTLVYGWTEPGADRIGVNPGWIRLQCDLDTPKMRKFQHWLRADS